MKQFLKESFTNGNRYTNILITVILMLVSIIGYFLKSMYEDFQCMKTSINNETLEIERLKGKDLLLESTLQEIKLDLKDYIKNQNKE